MSGQGDSIIVAAGQITARLMNEAPATLEAIERTIALAAEMRVQLLVLPECAYPAYLLGSITSYRAGDHLAGQAYVEWLCARAEHFGLHIISGFVEDAGDKLHNAAVFIDDRGREIGRGRKRFLWNADHDWFSPGEEIRAFDSGIGRIGMVICAETRVPEILATLAADGAELIALPTCWINHAREPGQYYNPQVEYLIEARAREFGLPFVCADKAGLELGTVGYVGSSRIVRADGSLAAEAPASGETVIAAQLILRSPPRPRMSGAQQAALLRPRKARVGDSQTPPRRIPATAVLAEALALQANGRSLPAGVFQFGSAKAGCVVGQDARSFAAARLLALDGAEILLFFDVPRDLPLLRTRAMENRVFVVGMAADRAVIIGPDGALLVDTQGLGAVEMGMEIDVFQAADKLVAPKTDIFAERRVDLYHF